MRHARPKGRTIGSGGWVGVAEASVVFTAFDHRVVYLYEHAYYPHFGIDPSLIDINKNSFFKRSERARLLPFAFVVAVVHGVARLAAARPARVPPSPADAPLCRPGKTHGGRARPCLTLSSSGRKVLVDTGVGKANVLAALDAIGRGPVRYVVNSHWHFDHTDGNGWLNAAVATIVAHENTRKRMSAATRVEGWGFTFPPSPQGALPAIVFRGGTGSHVNNTAVALEAYAPCHTDTDVRVTFPDADVVALGDT